VDQALGGEEFLHRFLDSDLAKKESAAFFTILCRQKERQTGMTRGQLEAEISRLMVQFAKEQLGRGPEGARTRLFEDVIFVRLSGVLTRAEKHLASQPDGARLIKEMRLRLMESSRAALEQLVTEKTGCQLVSLHTDLSTRTGEEVLVFVLNQDLEQALSL